MSICFSDFNKICEFLIEIFHSYVYKAYWSNDVTVFNFIDPNYKIEISVLNLEEKITVQIIYMDIMSQCHFVHLIPQFVTMKAGNACLLLLN